MISFNQMIRVTMVGCLAWMIAGQAHADDMPWVKVAMDNKGFVLDPTGRKFTPWGFCYDHDDPKNRLLEDYWDADWATVEEDFKEMQNLGVNVIRIQLQLGKFMETPDKPNEKSLDLLTKLLGLAERTKLYLDLTGLGCFVKKEVPAWYDKLSEKDRWDVQVRFWEAVAGRCAHSPAVFCYNLMNEPIVPSNRRKEGDWLSGKLGDRYFIQYISLDQKDRPRSDIAREWIRHLSAGIRKHDKRHLITVGLLEISLDRPGVTSGFVPEKIVDDLDFLCAHIYPENKKVEEALKTLEGFSVGKPVVLEENYPLHCSMAELEQFIDGSKNHAHGWIGFYWGRTPEELRRSKAPRDAKMLGLLEFIEKNAKAQKE